MIAFQLLPLYLYVNTECWFPFYLVHNLSALNKYTQSFAVLLSWSDLSPTTVYRLLLNPSNLLPFLMGLLELTQFCPVLLSACTATVINTLNLSVVYHLSSQTIWILFNRTTFLIWAKYHVLTDFCLVISVDFWWGQFFIILDFTNSYSWPLILGKLVNL